MQKESINMSKKSRKMKKTNLMKWDDLIRNTKKITPFCDAKKKKRLKDGGENCQEENNNI